MTNFAGNLLIVAQYLTSHGLGRPEEEGFARSAMNRSYYGPYCIIRAAIEAQSTNAFQSRGMHNKLINVLVKSQDPHIAGIGKRLQSLRDYRERADYDFSGVVLMNEAQTATAVCAKCLDKIEKLSNTQWGRIAGEVSRAF